jgi:hypothetical protein
MAASPARVLATNRTLVWFSDEAERRRRAATAAQQASRCAAEAGGIGIDDASYDEIRGRAQARREVYVAALFRHLAASFAAVPRRAPALATGGMAPSRAKAWWRPELFGCGAFAALGLAMIGGSSFDPGMRTCRTEPAVLAAGIAAEARMTVSHNAACAMWQKPGTGAIDAVDIAVAPQHGNLTLRGRTGVVYRPARGFTGRDSFAFALRGRSSLGDGASLVRVEVTVR